MILDGFEMGFSMMSAIEILFPIIFLAIFAFVIVMLIIGIRQWSHNNAQPQIPAPARVVAKRQDISHHHHHGGASHGHTAHAHTSHTSTWYYATFEFENGQRQELSLSPYDYGMLAEGDEGTLTLQGTRFIRFERRKNP